MNDQESLEEILGYKFKTSSLLQQALTHPSLRYEKGSSKPDNQRLEFLGDAVVQILVSDMLYHEFPNADEGVLTKTRATIVSSKGLAHIARISNFGSYLQMGRAEASNGGRNRDSSLADVVEAILGAIYLDGGLESARLTAHRLFHSHITQAKSLFIDDANPKGRLQEIIQDYTNILPCYRIISESGPDHKKDFSAEVSWDGHILGQGAGCSKKEAEITAALAAVRNPNLMTIIRGKSAR